MGTDDDVAHLAIPEEEHFLHHECDYILHGHVVLKEATFAHAHLPDVKHFQVGHKALGEMQDAIKQGGKTTYSGSATTHALVQPPLSLWQVASTTVPSMHPSPQTWHALLC